MHESFTARSSAKKIQDMDELKNQHITISALIISLYKTIQDSIDRTRFRENMTIIKSPKYLLKANVITKLY